MHQIHRSRAFVLNSFPFGESDKQLLLLSEEYGLIRVRAQGIRKEKSKLRQSIQEYSNCDIALVHGKVGWRLTNAAFRFNIISDIENDEIRIATIRVLNLISRLVVDEEPEDYLYNIVSEFVNLAKEKEEMNAQVFENMFLLSILNRLGYIDYKPFENITDYNSIDEKQQKEMVQMINRGIRESGLLK